jgi:hypothetical protein
LSVITDVNPSIFPVSILFPEFFANYRAFGFGTGLDKTSSTNRALRLDQRDKAGGAKAKKTTAYL